MSAHSGTWAGQLRGRVEPQVVPSSAGTSATRPDLAVDTLPADVAKTVESRCSPLTTERDARYYPSNNRIADALIESGGGIRPFEARQPASRDLRDSCLVPNPATAWRSWTLPGRHDRHSARKISGGGSLPPRPPSPTHHLCTRQRFFVGRRPAKVHRFSTGQPADRRDGVATTDYESGGEDRWRWR